MSHVTSDPYLFATEEGEREETRVAADALLIALQREHPEIVRRLQTRAAVYRRTETQQ
jgi:hypothetical protein